MDEKDYWQRYQKYHYSHDDLGLILDISRMDFGKEYLTSMEPLVYKALTDMQDLEKGAIANPDENRMVGHYWLRKPELSPNENIRDEIEKAIEEIKAFVKKIHSGEIKGSTKKRFEKFLLIGIGGSALGPQLMADAFAGMKKNINIQPFFLDNTDPDGIDSVINEIGEALGETLIIVISKSGGTIETHNGMQEIKEEYKKRGLNFFQNAVAITLKESKLDNMARLENWLAIFPLWDWVGGRTSVTSPVGLLPAALQGIDIDDFLLGASICDEATRSFETRDNPAALLALMWYYATDGTGKKDMVIMPYKDQLQLMSRYLQQLLMESLGKEKDIKGNIVMQGLSVYGNKGSTDQHAYVQQLLDGVKNSFVTFIEVRKTKRKENIFIKEGVTSGDYLFAFLQGTRAALTKKGRESITISLEEINERSLGTLIALFERAVGLYASLVGINAYHQPGVELGKKGANDVIDIQVKLLNFIKKNPGQKYSIQDLVCKTGLEEKIETVYKVLEYLACNEQREIKKEKGKNNFDGKYYT